MAVIFTEISSALLPLVTYQEISGKISKVHTLQSMSKDIVQHKVLRTLLTLVGSFYTFLYKKFL